jgi:fimbrial isopeptide formation D2 family protein
MVFDSFDGKPINGAQITLINDATGQPAKVYAYDGVTPNPSTVISGQEVTDSGGNHYQFDAGEFVFPLTALGTYRLQIQPPAPYVAPSKASPAALALLHKPGGGAFEITPASFGAAFTLADLEPLQIDVPVDAPGADITVTKQISRVTAQPGDMLVYKVSVRNPNGDRATRAITLTDSASQWLRIRPESVRVDGLDAGSALALASDGHGFTLDLAPLDPQAEHTVTYMMTVRADAPPGQAVNHATGKTQDGLEADAQAMVKIERDALTDRMTLIGQVTAGGCDAKGKGPGVPGVRVMLEDGSFVVTDLDGRYHFEGLVPGTHVVQAAPETLPEGSHFVDCARSTHNAGSANSFFVRGQGGSLARADFHAVVPAEALAKSARAEPQVATDREAAGAETDWLAQGDGPPAFLFPTAEHNPRSPSVRVVIRHGAKQSVKLTANGEAVDPLSFEATNVSPDGKYAVSIWRAIRLKTNLTHLVATVRNADGSTAEELTRDVRFADTPMRGEVLKNQSHLVADGVSKPVLAVRLTDRYGNPVHAGVSGTFTVNSPYQSASAVEAQQSKALTGFGSASASWLVDGDDGIAHIELAPTMVSGALHLEFQFSDGDTHREESLESWVEPGDQPWTLIGLAEGALGSESVASNMERDGNFDSDLGKNARVAFYAKGRVLGRYLLTVAYDSAKQKADQQLLGIIDPNAYYTVFADNTQRLYDAASHEKLYVRIESGAFYALFGDFDTGFDQTTLAAYQRTLTGAKGEAQLGKVHLAGFVAKTGSSHVRDEIQGNGLTGPYRLSNRGILANSEHVKIEVRDRLRSELILDSRDLIRFVDYNIDQLSGTITFTQPVLSRDDQLNPQFIVIDYEVDNTSGKSEWNGGARATWTSTDGKVRIGATGITDKGDSGDRTTLGAADLRMRIGTTTEIRVEAAASTKAGNVSKAGSVEVEHRTGKVDLLAYAHQTDADYGVGQQNLSERGQRKFGADARVSITDQLSITTTAWLSQNLADAGEQKALEVRGAWRSQTTDAYLGVSYLSEHTPTGNDGASTVLEAGVTQHLLGNRLEVSGASSLALSNTEAIDLPTRHQLGLRYSITPTIKAVATYEIARGDAIDANTLKAGVEFTPWQGGTITTTLGKQEMGADANRTFAAYALGQTFQLNSKLTIDATVDGNKTLGGGIPLSAVVNPSYPVSSGGQLGDDGSLGEDFTAYSLGISWQSGRWSARARGEYRNGEYEDQKGFSFAAIRQLGEGSVVGSGLTWTRAASVNGTTSEVADGQLSFAHRPSGSDLSFLGKLEYRSDIVTGAVAG